MVRRRPPPPRAPWGQQPPPVLQGLGVVQCVEVRTADVSCFLHGLNGLTCRRPRRGDRIRERILFLRLHIHATLRPELTCTLLGVVAIPCQSGRKTRLPEPSLLRRFKGSDLRWRLDVIAMPQAVPFERCGGRWVSQRHIGRGMAVVGVPRAWQFSITQAPESSISSLPLQACPCRGGGMVEMVQ
eukprot:COSAG03_NODE_1812_length_3480_cov_1.693878_3_plen_185_part_00